MAREGSRCGPCRGRGAGREGQQGGAFHTCAARAGPLGVASLLDLKSSLLLAAAAAAASAAASAAAATTAATAAGTPTWTPTQPPGPDQPLSQYVKPVKVAPPPLAERDLRSGAAPTTGSPLLRPSGHFRHMHADLWDPHPQYRFSAFGISFWLQLAHDASFVDPNILVTHMTSNTTVRAPARLHAQCFYTGRVRDDSKSSVAVNLCHGM
ncbi:A disintegrin and metalloproteinase with thrombospondin motifs 8, partial [Frankliniella fusca]